MTLVICYEALTKNLPRIEFIKYAEARIPRKSLVFCLQIVR